METTFISGCGPMVKGGNHKTLKDWKTKYGSGVVESWLNS